MRKSCRAPVTNIWWVFLRRERNRVSHGATHYLGIDKGFLVLSTL